MFCNDLLKQNLRSNPFCWTNRWSSLILTFTYIFFYIYFICAQKQVLQASCWLDIVMQPLCFSGCLCALWGNHMLSLFCTWMLMWFQTSVWQRTYVWVDLLWLWSVQSVILQWTECVFMCGHTLKTLDVLLWQVLISIL